MSNSPTGVLPDTLKKLLFLLCDGNFHSGAQLGEALGLTRSAIWKLVKKMSDFGLTIEAITNKGYRIPGGVSLLEKNKVLSFVETHHQRSLEALEIFDSISSTNDYLLQIRPPINTACFAETQTAGRGRRGRSWISPFAKNIYLSLLWTFPSDPSVLTGLSLAIAVSLVETLRTFGIVKNLGIKWPNDILSDHQKLAGILVEIAGEAQSNCHAVIGIGVNVDMGSHPKADHIGQTWTDLRTLYEAPIDRNQIAGLLLNDLIKNVEVYQTLGFSAFIERWQQLDLTENKPVSIITPTHTITGIGRGIHKNGQFMIENESGVIQYFSSGEVSLRLV